MLQTTHYNLTKPELQDSPPDITVMNPNWDLIDTYLHEAYINKLIAVDEIPAAPLPRDADRLGGFAASYFAPASLAQMKKLTDDNGLPLSTATDLNAMTNSGMYRVTAATLNGVPGNTTGILQVLKRDNDTFVFQQLQATGDGFLYRYSANNGVSWSSWKTSAFAENAIVETGSNANGSYIKFGDGTLICWTLKTLSSAVSTAWGALYYHAAQSWIFPIAFIRDKPVAFASATDSVSELLGMVPYSTLNSLQFYGVRPTVVSTATTLNYRLFAIGRWK